MQISGPPFSPLPPGSGGVPGVCASWLLQGRTPDAWPQRTPGPSLQQLRDRVDHQGAGRHAPLRTAHPGRVNRATDGGREGGGVYSGGGWEGPCGTPHPFNKLTTKSNPCLERETPLESSCSYCGLLTIQHYCYFVYFVGFSVVCSWTLLTAGSYGGFKEEQTLPALYVSDTRGRFLNFSSTRYCSYATVFVFLPRLCSS